MRKTVLLLAPLVTGIALVACSPSQEFPIENTAAQNVAYRLAPLSVPPFLVDRLDRTPLAEAEMSQAAAESILAGQTIGNPGIRQTLAAETAGGAFLDPSLQRLVLGAPSGQTAGATIERVGREPLAD